MTAPRHRVVVGIDDSPSARVALRHALQEARERSVALDVVVAAEHARSAARVLAAARAVVDEVLAGDAVERVGLPAPEVHVLVAIGRPGPTLVAAARGADLLVVGHRGHGGALPGIGSVAWSCLGRADCPVAVVPAPGVPQRPWPRERELAEAP